MDGLLEAMHCVLTGADRVSTVSAGAAHLAFAGGDRIRVPGSERLVSALATSRSRQLWRRGTSRMIAFASAGALQQCHDSDHADQVKGTIPVAYCGFDATAIASSTGGAT
jgi:hypothetical protein